MTNYLLEMDSLQTQFLETHSDDDKIFYVKKELYFYQPIEFVYEDIVFHCNFNAVKVSKTTIVLIDPSNGIKVHFSDEDLIEIIDQLKSDNCDLYGYLEKQIIKIINKEKQDEIAFTLSKVPFTIHGIPFKKAFNNTVVSNPADININGNDLIGLINLIFEKERTDNTTNKVIRTAKKYFKIK